LKPIFVFDFKIFNGIVTVEVNLANKLYGSILFGDTAGCLSGKGKAAFNDESLMNIRLDSNEELSWSVYNSGISHLNCPFCDQCSNSIYRSKYSF
jgi:hypothetical protein